MAGFKIVELVHTNIWENKIHFCLYITVITAHTWTRMLQQVR